MIFLMTTNLRECITPSFFDVHRKIRNNEYSTFWLKGGRGSTKSSFAAIQIILGVIQDPDANALALRKVDGTCRTSVLQMLLWATEVLDVESSFDFTTSPAEITYLPTGQKIIMKGLDDARKIKSIKLKRGYFKFLWWEEAEEFAGMEEIRSVRQSTRRGGESFVEFITFNPPNDPAAWVNAAAEEAEDDADAFVHHSTYLDVDRDWLGAQFFKDAERLRKKDMLAYNHEYLGQAVGRAEQIVYFGKWQEKDFITPDVGKMYQGRFFFGADWGFANDPTTLLRCFIMKEHGEVNLYIDYEVGGRGVDMDELPQLFDTIPESRKWKIYGDCARPETVSYITNNGFHCESAPKWPGSVEDGIEYIKGFDNIYVHTRCPKTAEEFTKYSYKVDKHTKEILPVIVKKFDHFLDALRYALADYIQREVSILDVL
jgi:PBSX family phage terminase large subunit